MNSKIKEEFNVEIIDKKPIKVCPKEKLCIIYMLGDCISKE